jgi:cyanate permease
MKFSKLNLIHCVNLVLILGNLLCQIEVVWVQLIGRFIWGLSVGVFTVLVPKFINETAASELKGPFGAMS